MTASQLAQDIYLSLLLRTMNSRKRQLFFFLPLNPLFSFLFYLVLQLTLEKVTEETAENKRDGQCRVF